MSIGSFVKLRDEENKDEFEFKIVGSTEATSLGGAMSNESPVGKAILGKKKGDVVVVEMPGGGSFKYKIMSISKNGR